MKIKEILSIDNFDPLNVDVSFLDNVSELIPQDGFMDLAMAEHLATITLKAADQCTDLLAQATLFLSHTDAKKKSVKAKVIREMYGNKVPSTIVKEAFANDDEFIEATNVYNVAQAWHIWLGSKQSTLIKTHHLCKDLIKKAYSLESTAGWDSSSNTTVIPRNADVKKDLSKRKPGKSGWQV